MEALSVVISMLRNNLGNIGQLGNDAAATAAAGGAGMLGNIKGSPDDVQMEPVSYGAGGFRGGHGGLFRVLNPFSRVEPGDRADDNDFRRNSAQQFTQDKFLEYLTKWMNGCCCAK